MSAAAAWRRGSGIARAASNALRRPPAVGDPPLVSVVIATYNWSEVLRWAIRSVRSQSYPRWELIVVGDCCTDDSGAVVASFADSRIRWHNRAVNAGSQSLPNNDGIAMARGELVAYLGHDDLWTPDHLARLVAARATAGADIAFSLSEVIGPPGSGMRNISGFKPHGYGGGHLPPSSLLHRRDLVERIGGWRDYRDIEQPPDTELLERALSAGASFACSWALTAFKLPSAMRRNSYVERRSDEQAELARRMQGETAFQLRELARAVASRARRPGSDPNRFAPQVGPEDGKGAYVRAARRARGLDP
ncbi:MAG TPA: glycosyltransferase [Solirubrobacterales bacterium]|nr:glycosyltransferase [Solirubrobacterales bacterium]